MRGVRSPAIGAASAGPPPQAHTQGVSRGSPARPCECPQGPRGPAGGCAFPYVCILRALVPSPDPMLGSREFLETVGLCFSGVLCPRPGSAPTLSSRRGACGDPATPALGGPQERREFHVVWCLLSCPCGGRGAVCVLGVSGESPLSSASEEPHKPLPGGSPRPSEGQLPILSPLPR